MEEDDIDWALAMANENLIDKETFQVDETPSGPLELIDKLKKQNKHIGRKEQKRKYSELYNTIIEKKDCSTLSKEIRRNHIELYHSIEELQALEKKIADLSEQEHLCSIVGSVKQIPVKPSLLKISKGMKSTSVRDVLIIKWKIICIRNIMSVDVTADFVITCQAIGTACTTIARTQVNIYGMKLCINKAMLVLQNDFFYVTLIFCNQKSMDFLYCIFLSSI